MQLTKQQFHENLLATLNEVLPDNLASEKASRFVITPVYEQNVKHTSVDDYLRLALLTNKNIKDRLFDSESLVTFLSGPNSLFPLWINVIPKEHTGDYNLFELKISTRFRKPSELKNRETGHPPFKAVL